ncbi:MAG: TPM domain-containing protein [Acidobacteriota bacterium]
MDVHSFFSPADAAEIEKAVKSAELTTSGEIVPYAVNQSDHYHEAMWKASTLGALAGALGAAFVHEVASVWGYGWLWLALPTALGAAVGYVLATLIVPLRRWLVPVEERERMVQLRAAAAFLEQEVFKTRDRTGILVFVSIFERRVVILADAGITALVGQAEWNAIVDEIVVGIRSGAPGTALARAIGRCGELLRDRRVTRRADDTDELADKLQLRTE